MVHSHAGKGGESMKKQLIGYNRYLFTFSLNEREKYLACLESEKSKGGTVELRFINNAYAFEVKRTVI